MVCCSNGLRARKIPGYFVEPIKEGFSRRWESHHTTNPCVVRFEQDSRVFLGYRAGGEDDMYTNGHTDIWGSHLGLAILDAQGLNVAARLPLPIFWGLNEAKLPRTKEEYSENVDNRNDDIVLAHDFRFFNYNGFLHVIHHKASVNDVFDCIERMKIEDFIQRVDKSLELMRRPTEQIVEDWRRLWWADGVWTPCGVGGTDRIFGSRVFKGDIVFMELENGTLQMDHRPMAEAIATLNTGKDTFAKATADGLTTYGTFESCMRPWKLDNSHIGVNGCPTRAKIGDVDVYIDVVHGCYDRMITDNSLNSHKITYYAYLRVKDFQSGEVFYYSEEPLVDFDEIWREYAEQGEWVMGLEHLDGVMFAGGHVEIQKGKNGLDDDFITYLGLGDTSVGAAVFKLRDVLPQSVIDDIQTRKQHKQYPAVFPAAGKFDFPEEINGWKWSLTNNAAGRNIKVIREFKTGRGVEIADRIINSVPGKFDSDAVIFDGKSIRYLEGIGWAIIYKGIKWDIVDGKKTTIAGFGILLLDDDNPERVLYRSEEAIAGTSHCADGWVFETSYDACGLIENAESLIGEKAVSLIKRWHSFSQKGQMFYSQMITWQRHKSGLLSRDVRLYIKTPETKKD